MRATFLQSVDLKRNSPYDPDFHGLIDRQFDIGVHLEKAEPGSATFRISIHVSFVVQGTGQEMGRLDASGTTRITGDASLIPPADRMDDSVLGKVSPEFQKLLEGAVNEDLLLPLSILCRAAKLPGLFPNPLLFRPKHALPSPQKAPAGGPNKALVARRRSAPPARSTAVSAKGTTTEPSPGT